MNDASFQAANNLKQQKKHLLNLKASLIAGHITAALLLDVYTALGEVSDYADYLNGLKAGIDTKITSIEADYEAL